MFKFDKNGKRKDFPKGCDDCNAAKNSTPEALEWQCQNGCEWPKNYWKYDEIKYYHVLAQWKKAGIDLNRIDDLVPQDFLKCKIVADFLKI